MASDSIAFSRARGMGPLPDLVEARAGERALYRLFEQEGLPLSLRELPQVPIPLEAMMRLFERASRQLGERTFGLEVGRGMNHRGYGLWTEYATGGRTLGEALRRAIDTSWAHLSGSHLELARGQDHWILRFVAPPMAVSTMQHSDHVLLPLLSLARHYLGRAWQPAWVEVDYPRDQAAHLLEEALDIPARFGRPGTGLALAAEDLLQQHAVNRPHRIVTLQDIKADLTLIEAGEPARSISSVVALRLLDGKSDIEGAAQLVGLSVQTLQRRLRHKGYTYREVLAATRFARAKVLLGETQLTIMEIALSLGYEDHANFTRAFKRWAGASPTTYRRARSGGKIRRPV